MNFLTRRITQRLALQKKNNLYRNPPAIAARKGRTLTVGQKKLLNFASNDYLGLGSSERLAFEVARNFQKYGASGSSSRLVSGNYGAIRDAEAALSQYFGYDSALIYPSGYQCNLGVIATLFEKNDRVLADKHIHASGVAALKLSGARLYGFKHNRISHLEKRLAGLDRPAAGILTESLFSMDGDLLDVAGLARVKTDHGVPVLVDEAHAFGALGEKGRGIARFAADLAVGTLGKAFGLFGAFALLPHHFREYLLNFSSPLIYTTTLPEAHGASVVSALKLLAAADSRRQKLAELSRALKNGLRQADFVVGGDAHIISVAIGSEKKAGAYCARLFDKGLFVFSARFPTVPLNKAILRISMTAAHTRSDVDTLLTGLTEVRHALEP